MTSHPLHAYQGSAWGGRALERDPVALTEVQEGAHMRCLKCQFENRETARFCAACGSPLAWMCSACGNQPPLGAAFCDHCGRPLTGELPAPPPQPLAPRPRFPLTYSPEHLAEK